MAAGHVLGWINTRIILGVIFYFIVTQSASSEAGSEKILWDVS